jgi:simple sugar transport system ATP-binding protein
LVNLTKTFGSLVACDHVSLDVKPGEVHALLGENGAGKSTLMRCLFGLAKPDDGWVEIAGQRVTISSPGDAIRSGLGMVTQEFSLVGPMSVTENVLLARSSWGRLDVAGGRAAVAAAAERLGVEVDPDARVEDLSIGERQRVEILKALVGDCRLLILDEPTAVLTPQDSVALFTAVRRLVAQGMGVLLISHKLREVLDIANRISVLRHGRLTATVDLATEQVEPADLARLMVGAEAMASPEFVEATGLDVVRPHQDGLFLKTEVDTGAHPVPVLAVKGLRVDGEARPLLQIDHLEVGSGEIVGVAGVSGNGQSELGAVLCAIKTPAAGTISLGGKDVTALGPAARFEAGLGRILEDRRASIAPTLSVEHTLVLEDLDAFKRGPFLNRHRIRRHAHKAIERYAIKAAPADPVGTLSGGNMQKVLLARALSRRPRAIIASQPTRGLDVGACEFVHDQLKACAADGAGVLLISEDLDEILLLADTIVVLYEGRIAATLARDDADMATLGLLMAGAQPGASAHAGAAAQPAATAPAAAGAAKEVAA